MQKYTVLVGVNGAGLMNALYLPPFAVAVQLVPYNASVSGVFPSRDVACLSIARMPLPEHWRQLGVEQRKERTDD